MNFILGNAAERSKKGFIHVGIFGACAAGHHADTDGKKCPKFAVDFECTCVCHEDTDPVLRKPAPSGWCLTGHHDDCPVIRGSETVCSCTCHHNQVVAQPRLKLKKRGRRG